MNVTHIVYRLLEHVHPHFLESKGTFTAPHNVTALPLPNPAVLATTVLTLHRVQLYKILVLSLTFPTLPQLANFGIPGAMEQRFGRTKRSLSMLGQFEAAFRRNSRYMRCPGRSEASLPYMRTEDTQLTLVLS